MRRLDRVLHRRLLTAWAGAAVLLSVYGGASVAALAAEAILTSADPPLDPAGPVGDLALAALSTPAAAVLIGRARLARIKWQQHRRRVAEQAGLKALIAALDARDEYTGDHSEAVVELAGGVARALGLPEYLITEVEQVALLHDIGKIGIPDGILRKQGPLSDEEWAIMRQHPVIGERIVAAIESLRHLAPALRHEHERWDGTGYPDGLCGRAIPLASRIILACDAYHAMVSDRPYRKSIGWEAAISELVKHSGSQFCPDTVRALLDVICEGRLAALTDDAA